MPARPALPLLVFLALLALSLLLRWGTSFISVINHDESTYIVIADALRNGAVYLRDVIDTKPIGIFWLYAGMEWVTGGSIVGLRLLTTAVVALTAFLLFLTARRPFGSDAMGWAAGLAYPCLCSLYTYYGISPNTELFFNAFTVAAVAVAVAPRVGPAGRPAFWQWPVAGVLLGAAAVIKPFVAADALAFGQRACTTNPIIGDGANQGKGLLLVVELRCANVNAQMAALGSGSKTVKDGVFHEGLKE